jgi:hypothetical protein
MFYMPRSYVNTEHLLGFNVVDDEGFLVDPETVEFRILTAAGANVFPVAGYEDVRTTAGRLGTGRYYAYDTTVDDVPWTVDAAQAEGIYTIEWRWNLIGGAQQTFTEKFEIVLDAQGDTTGFVGLPFRTYIAPGQLRSENVTVAFLSDERMEFLFEVVQSTIEERTRNIFRQVYRTIRFDGPHADRIFLGQAIIGLEELTRPDGTQITSNSNLAVAFERADQSHRYRPYPDHRRNPTVALAGSSDIYSGGFYATTHGKFGTGRMYYRLKGVFGFVELDGTVPALLQDAFKRLVIYSATLLADELTGGSTTAASAGPLKKVRAGGYEIEYNTDAGGSTSLSAALSRSRIVEEELKQFRAPQAIATTKPNVAFASVTG